ncbi:MAG TPA: MerR family DNA-binding transcriptional regulator [Mycobacterium sp.]|nr:MerR family DNA-binding transcriptional regulator [Mycobacterium sp.]
MTDSRTEETVPAAPYLTVKEAAERIGLSIDTLKRAEERGQIVPLRTPGGHRRYRVEDVDALLKPRAS